VILILIHYTLLQKMGNYLEQQKLVTRVINGSNLQQGN